MITAERLKELIKQGEGIYKLDSGKIYKIQLINNNDYKVNIGTQDLYIDWRERNEYGYGWWKNDRISFENLFETKEEAEWELEFGNIARTETLRLPSWNDAQKGISYQFYAPKGNVYLLETKVKTGYSCDRENPYIIRIERIGYSNNENDYEFNKDNYIEACRLAKKLFMGEKQ